MGYFSKPAVLSHHKYLLAKVAELLVANGTDLSVKDLVSMMTSTPDYRPELILDTDVGTMRFGIIGPGLRPRQNHLGWVYCQFDDVEAAKARIKPYGVSERLNPYSGKWNYMFHDDDRWEVHAFVNSLESIRVRNLRHRVIR